MKTVITLLLSTAALFAQSISTPTPNQLFTYGEWPLCVDGVFPAAECQWYVPGTETYLLAIESGQNGPGIISYQYTLRVELENGLTTNVTAIVPNQPNEYGYVIVGPLTFGGIVQSCQTFITPLTAHTPVSRKTHGRGN